MEHSDRRRRAAQALGWALLCALLAGLAWTMIPMDGRVDEGEHRDQILRFVHGDLTLNPVLTTVPGFHALIAAVAAVTGADTLQALRVIAFGISVGAVATFAACSQMLTADRTQVRTAQWILFPILTPFFTLLYTDVASLAFVLLAMLATLRRRYGLAGLFALASMAMRQNNVVWLVFFLALAVIDARREAPERPWSRSPWLGVYVVALGLFGLFVGVNGGVAVGDQPSHPFPDVHASNVYFLLFLHFVFFLPEHLSRAGKVVALVRGRPWLLGALALAFPLFLATFTNTHALNIGNEQDRFFLRNRVLEFLVGPLDHMVLAFIVIAWTVLSLAVTPLVRREYALLYPFTVLFLVPSWLVEQRYTLIPFTLFMLVRARSSARVEWATALWFVPFTIYFLWGIRAAWFFL